MAFVYILQSLRNQTYYIGSTDNLERRLREHLQGRSIYTKPLLPLVLVFSQKFPNIKIARRVEFWIKKQKSREFIERLIQEGTIRKRFN